MDNVNASVTVSKIVAVILGKLSKIGKEKHSWFLEASTNDTASIKRKVCHDTKCEIQDPNVKLFLIFNLF